MLFATRQNIYMSANKMTTLDKLGIGKDAVIESIECENKALRSHILDMG